MYMWLVTGARIFIMTMTFNGFFVAEACLQCQSIGAMTDLTRCHKSVKCPVHFERGEIM